MTKEQGTLAIGKPGWTPTKVHPLATIFPMMPDNELAELAEDIKANGLLSPIIVDDGGVLIEGRNRLRACQMAGVDPRFEELNGRDPISVIRSANLLRRNITKGQQAMAFAFLYPEPGKGGRGKKSAALNSAETAEFSSRRLNDARSILHHSDALAHDVVAGRMRFDEALERVEKAKQQSKSVESALDRLRAADADLAAKVDEGELTLQGAQAVAAVQWAKRTGGKFCRRDTYEQKKPARERSSGAFGTMLAGVVRLLTGTERSETPEESRDRQLRALGYGHLIR